MSAKRTKRETADNEPAAKKKKTTETGTTPSKKKSIEATTEEQYAVINSYLGFTIHTCPALGINYAHCAATVENLFFFAFPVLTRPPAGPGLLPERLPSGDRGYFLGATDPSVIFCAITEAYKKTHPNCNPTVAPWRNWEAYMNNKLYYGAHDFEKSGGRQDINAIANELLVLRETGGRENPIQAPVARLSTQKKYQKAVMLAEEFAEKMPESGATGRFYTRSELAARREAYNNHRKAQLELLNEKLAKKIGSILESSDSEDEASGDEDN